LTALFVTRTQSSFSTNLRSRPLLCQVGNLMDEDSRSAEYRRPSSDLVILDDQLHGVAIASKVAIDALCHGLDVHHIR